MVIRHYRNLICPYTRKQTGLSLIELMIALSLGTLLVAGAIRIFMSNTQAFRLQDNVSTAQENGRLALEILLHDLRRAGYGGLTTSDPIVGIIGKDNSASAGKFPGLLKNHDGSGSDEITIIYKADTDCEGNNVDANDNVHNRYHIAMDNGLPALFCSGTKTGTGASLVRGVESFQILYGVTDFPGNGYARPIRYIPANPDAVTDLDFNQAAIIKALDSSGAVANVPVIATVRVALVVRSEHGVNGLPAGDGINDSDNMTVLDTHILYADLAKVSDDKNHWPVVHRYFSGTAVMRNAPQGAFIQ